MKNYIFKNASKRGISLLMAIVMMFTSVLPTSAEEDKYVILKAGTPVMLELITNVSSNKSHVGDIVDFRVTNDVKVKGDVVIPAGSIARGQVTYASKSNFIGIPGEVSVTVRSVTAVDGSQIPLSSAGISNEGNDKMVISIVLTVLCILGLAIRGEKGRLVSGTPISASVATDVEIGLK